MRVLLALLLAVHGAIHLLGAFKGLRVASVAPLRRQITPLGGVLWLAAALLLLASAGLVTADAEAWWLPALSGIALSQALIVSDWQDARFGTLANVLVVLPLAVALLDFRPDSLRSTFRRDVRVHQFARTEDAPLVGAQDLAPLPAPVQTYLRRAGVVGKPRVRNFHAEFSADMRAAPSEPWMHSRADQYEFFRPSPTARLFFMQATRSGVPFDVLHRYHADGATMQVRVAGLVPVTDAGGAEMTQSETVTLLNDMVILAPATLVDAPIRWESVDDHTVRATFTNAGHTVHAELVFDAAGDLADFRSDDRYRIDGRRAQRLRWTTPVSDYRDYGGVRLAARGDAQWTEGTSTWAYGRFVLERIAYNVERP